MSEINSKCCGIVHNAGVRMIPTVDVMSCGVMPCGLVGEYVACLDNVGGLCHGEGAKPV